MHNYLWPNAYATFPPNLKDSDVTISVSFNKLTVIFQYNINTTKQLQCRLPSWAHVVNLIIISVVL